MSDISTCSPRTRLLLFAFLPDRIQLMPRRLVFAFALLLSLAPLCAAPALAQSQNDGSIYTRFGLGTRYAFTSSQAQAMGGAGMALRSFNYVALDNPATWADQVLVRFSGGLRVDGLEASDASDATSRLTSGTLNSVQLGVPLYAGKLGAVASLRPYTDVNFRVDQPGTFIGLDGAEADFVLQYEGDGGIQELQIGLGYKPATQFSVGASVGFLFGIIEQRQRTIFPDLVNVNSPTLAASALSDQTRVFGLALNLGASVGFPKVFTEVDALGLAAAITLPVSLAGDRVTTLGESLNRDTLGTLQEGTIDVPLSVRGGASYVTGGRWAFAVDALYEPWSGFESDFAFPGNAIGYSDRIRVGGGLEFTPAGRRTVNVNYFRRAAYRLGAYYDQEYAQPEAGYTLRTMAVTAGLSLPTILPGTRLDTNVEVGTRGATERNLVRDTFLRFTVTANIGERWFVRRKLR